MSRRRLARALRLVVRLSLVALFLLPLVWLIGAALLPPGRPLPRDLRLLPPGATLDNVARVWALLPLGRYTANSLLVCALAVPLTVVTGSWAGLAIALQSRAAQRRWVVLSLAVLMVPGIALWSTRFIIYRELGWLDSTWALIAPAWMGTSPFYVLMFYRAFRRIPRAFYDAAWLDGANVLTLWRRVALPLARTTALGVALLAFVVYWGDLLSPLLYLSGDRLTTLPVGLQTLQQLSRSDWPLLMAGAAWATAVPVALFLVLQPTFARAASR